MEGTTRCMRVPDATQLTQVEVSDNALAGKDGDQSTSGKDGSPGGEMSHCNSSSHLNERHGRYCYAPCPSNQVSQGGGSCRTKCGGAYPAEGNLLCGISDVALSRAQHRMWVETIGNFVNIGTQIFVMAQEAEVNSNSLSSTLEALAQIGLPFAKPTCGDEHVGP